MPVIAFIQRHWWWLCLSALRLTTLASLYPADQLPAVSGSDKSHHLISYALITLPLALRQPRYWPWLATTIVLWSGAIELIQPYVNRYGEWLDLAANVAGVTIGTMIGIVIVRLTESLRQ